MTNDEKLYYVYKHTSPSGKVYIGITSKHPPELRWANGNGYKRNQPHFWNAIKKYGWDNFEHEILFEGLNRKDACIKEQEMIELYDATNSENGYNQTKGGDGKLGYVMSKETKQKISASRTGRFTGEDNPNYGNHKLAGKNNPFYGKRHTEETKKKLRELASGRKSSMKGKNFSEEFKEKLYQANKERSKPVLQFDIHGNLINEYRSVHNASTITGYDYANISAACNGKIHIYKNCIWMFKSEYTLGQIVKTTERKKRVNKKYKAVVQYDINNVFIATYTFANQAEFSTGIKANNIRACCNGDQKTSGGFIWRYDNGSN